MKSNLSRLPLVEPVRTPYDFSSGFGGRSDPFNNRAAIHEGIDFSAPIGTPVYATGEGKVIAAKTWGGYGRMIDIDHGNGIVTRYAHLSQIKVTPGQKVTRNTVIGLLGNSGRSSGPHLHYEIRVGGIPRDPVKFISVGRNVPKNR